MWHNTDNSKDHKNNQHLLNFYLKDFRYISPEVLGVHSKDSKGSEQKKYKLLARMWMSQVVRGIKLMFSQGSLHGVKYIFEPTFSRKERATWIIIMMVSIGICAGNITQLFSKWTSTPFVNVIDSLPSPVWAVPFPAVVLCPHNHAKLSYKNVSRFNDLEKYFASLVCPHMSKEQRALEERMTPEETMMLEEFLLKGSPKCTEVVKSCYWRATSDAAWVAEECCSKLFKPIFTNYGLCFAFNSLPLNGMTNVTIPWQRTFNQEAASSPLSWGLDAGYPKVFPPDPAMQPFRVMASGEMNGLGVELFLNSSEHQVDCDGGSVGFNVIISSPTDHVYTSTIIRLPMDRMTTIEVYPITYRTDSSLRSLLPDRRQCFFQDERQLEYYQFYTDSNCKHDLLVREARSLCDCVYFNWPKKAPWEPVCSTISDFQCINKVKAKVEEQLIYAYFADSEEQRKPTEESSSCHPACNDVLYNSQVFYSDLKTDPTESPKWGYPGPGEITRINVHFYDDTFLGQHRHAQYDDYYFVGAIGGLLSLFLGFSIISVAELVYFVILRPLHVVFMEIWLHRGVESLRTLNEKLSAQVVAQVSSTQELVTMNKFEQEASEYLFKKCLQERISDIESWRWVLKDLSKRLGEAIDALRYEHKALRVVVGRVEEEIQQRSREASRPGAMTPQTDTVEAAIIEEYKFLRDQKKQFEKMLVDLYEETGSLEKIKNRIEIDVLGKQEAIKVEESCASIDVETATVGKKVKKTLTPMNRWENRCNSLKRKGLSAFAHALVMRQQVRAARTQLSVSAQSYATKVETALRRRMHANQSKLQELQWQRNEAIRDYQSLAEELTASEQSTLETMSKQRLVGARISDRRLRPVRELIKDSVDRKLRDEMGRLKQYLKYLRQNIERITSLQKDITASITQINCVEEDVSQVLRLDEDRMRGRYDEYESERVVAMTDYDSRHSRSSTSSNSNDSRARAQEGALTTIREDDEEEDDGVDDYPLDY